MQEEQKISLGLKQSFSIPKSSADSLSEILKISKEKWENVEIFLANLNIPDLPKEQVKKSIGLYIYYFSVTRNNKYTWIIKRSLHDFNDLFATLSKKYKDLTILRDFQYHISLKTNFIDPNNLLNYIEKALQIILKTPALQRDLELLAFFEVSFVPLEKGTPKYKECFVLKRSGGRFKPDNIFLRCGLYCKVWSKRWLVIRQDGVLYTLGPSLDKSYIREILFFDSSFQIEYGKKYTNSKKGIILTASSRRLHLEALNYLQFYDIINSLKEACEACPYTQINRFLSFSPPRQGDAYCKCYIDAEDYFADITEVIKQAKEEIFIADWWLSPELYLKRPVSENINHDSRLDKVLFAAAEEGVRINIIIYKEVTLALTNDSHYTKKRLEGLHKNIKVLRHPKDMIFLWSHHEKILIVDQEIAFMGGLDLCYGRFDNQAHKLRDVISTNNQKTEGMFPGIDYYNVRIVDFTNVRNFTQSTINKEMDQRMPWHDVAIRIIGEPVKDLTRHFIQYWNFVTYDLLKKNPKNNFLEVTVREKGHSKTVTHIMESSFIKKEREKSHKIGIFDKIQQKIQKTKESMKKILKKSKQPTTPKIYQPKSELVLNFHDKESEEKSNQNSDSKSREINDNDIDSFSHNSEESEEVALSRKKVSVYLDNAEREESLILSRCESENQLESIRSEEGLGEPRKKILEMTFVKKNQLKLKFANIEDMNFVSNSNEKINEVRESVFKSGKEKKKEKEKEKQENSPLEKNGTEKGKKKKGIIKKSISINSKSLGKLPKIVVFEEHGRFSLEKERILEMLYDQNDLYHLSPKKHLSRSHQHFASTRSNDARGFMSDEKNHFRKQLEDFTTYDRDILGAINHLLLERPKELESASNLLKSNYYIKVNKKNEESPKTKTERLKSFFQKNNLRLKNNFKHFKENLKHFASRKNTKSDEMQGNDDKNENTEDEFGPMNKKTESYQIKNFLAPNHKAMNTTNELFASKLTCSCQILRSASSWSLGLGPYQTEKSIHMAYIQLIEQSKHYVYIENQFFISNLAGAPVENLVANAILLRIKQAFSKNEKFKIFVFVPLLPGFPGDIDKPSAAVLKIQLHWEYFTISRGGYSLIECLVKEGIPPEEFIHFFSLRAHDTVGGVPKTEIIYIHSKMMIVDDQIALIGSANINDRSMIGSRDSDVNCKYKVVVEDTKKLDTRMNGKKYRASELIFNLRVNLFKEHFGLGSEELNDPLDDKLWDLLLARSKFHELYKKNTQIFREVFRCYPDDEIMHTDDIAEFEAKRNLGKYEETKSEIHGHVVDFPLRFLERQSLKLPIFTKEYLVPDINFV